MKLHITETSVVVHGMDGIRQAISTFPSLLTLSNHDVLLAYRVGSTKDSNDETVEIRRPSDAGRPAILPDGRVVLPWVDRFGSHPIRVRVARRIDTPLEADTEMEIYRLDTAVKQELQATATGDMLAGMGLWTFGLPFAEQMPNGDVLVTYYASTAKRMDIRLARLQLS